MAYLLLDFSKHTASLKQQYDRMCNKYPALRRQGIEFETFMNLCFNQATEKTYYISAPSIIRDKIISDDKYYNNIAIRPETDPAMQSIMPENADVIFMGYIYIKFKTFIIQQFDFLNDNVYKSGEIAFSAQAASAFSQKQIPGQQVIVPDYGPINFNEMQQNTVLTRDFVLNLLNTLFPVSDTFKVIKCYEDWKKYIDFRNYFIEKRRSQGFVFYNCKVIDAYTINKRDYSRNEDYYAKYLIPGLTPNDIKRNDEVVLNKKLENTEPFPLLCLEFRENKKAIEATRDRRNKPKYESDLYKRTRSPVFLTNANNDNPINLEERYKIYKEDIEPDYTTIEADYKRKENEALSNVDIHFAKRKKDELAKIKERLNRENEKEIADYKNFLDSNLGTAVMANADESIKKEFEKILKEKEDKVRSDIKQAEKNRKEAADKAKKDKKPDDVIKKIENEKTEIIRGLQKHLEDQKNTISLKDLYQKRNQKWINEKTQSLEDKAKNRIREEEKGLDIELSPQIADAKNKIRQKISDDLEKERENLKNEQTIRAYYVYYNLSSANPETIKNQIERQKPNLVAFDSKMESTKTDRQGKALNDFFTGNVKNPFLGTYLFEPDTLPKRTKKDWNKPVEFYSKRLNEKQEEAVKKALASNSLFLLQGPPGTGKTEVIAEIAAQYIKQGKRVLISSETHKAIDNVFDRLPKISEIRPLRLIPAFNKRETNYSPEKLVDNFYKNISAKMNAEIYEYEHYREYRNNFDNKYNELKMMNDKLNNEKAHYNKLQNDIQKKERKRTNELLPGLDDARQQLDIYREDKSKLESKEREIESLGFNNQSDVSLTDFKINIENAIKKYPCFIPSVCIAADIDSFDTNEANDDINQCLAMPDIVKLEAEKSVISGQIKDLQDDFGNFMPNTDEQRKKLQTRLREIVKKINDANTGAGFSLKDSRLVKILAEGVVNDAGKLKSVRDSLFAIKQDLRKIKNEEREKVIDEKNGLNKKTSDQENKVHSLEREIKKFTGEIEEARHNAGFLLYEKTEQNLKSAISKFFKDFSDSRNDTGNNNSIDMALEIIEKEWASLKNEFKKREKENKDKIPVYNKIINYLLQDTTIERDRREYTKELYQNVNLVGITASSKTFFDSTNNNDIREYNLDNINIENMGIDVVIIDEVSKSSFLDLLRPILFGKTIILVGDHRQLPPMYDLKHLKQEEMDEYELDFNIVNENINNEFTRLCETSYFKTLFEQIPDNLKVTLNKQYRCHEHIMNVFNNFYINKAKKGGLELGYSTQNIDKQHGLTVTINGKNIIEQNKHIYFIDCGSSREDFSDGTSATNALEADVISALARQINRVYGKMEKPEVNKERNIDMRPSLGVICTYGNQVKLVKKRLQKKDLTNLNESVEEKYIVSTVDDFQGDERDIIFVSFVRNPEKKNIWGTAGDFLKQFERINVALSRARKLLILVGAKDFLSQVSIDLPDPNGEIALDRHSCKIYNDIINTIYQFGKVINSRDVFERAK
jgi:superfamily I DNA and/or RNA helicase